MSTALSPPERQTQAVATGLRVAAAACICALVTERYHLAMGFMSCFSAHIVMSQYPFTSFQKGVERVLGRVVGVLYGLVLVALFHRMPILFLLLLALGETVAFYLYSSKRLSYAALQAGVFMPTVAYLGVTATPEAAPETARTIIVQVLLGVGVAMLINWLTGAEKTLELETAGAPLLPLHLDWLSQALMLAVISLTTMLLTVAFDLPVIPATVSSLFLGVTGDPVALRAKAWQRLLGVVFGGAYSIPAVLLLTRVPHLPLLLAFLALGMFGAACHTRASEAYSYVGLQAGIVVSMVLVSPTDDYGSADPALQRFVGVVVGTAVSLVVQLLWERRAAAG